MFKDFHRRLQRDLKKIVDARVLASEARLGGDIRVSIYMHHVVWLSLSLSLSLGNYFDIHVQSLAIIY